VEIKWFSPFLTPCFFVSFVFKVTKLDRDPASGTALQEISFWLNLERALYRIQEKRESPEVLLTLDILKHGKRFHATVSFDTDTGKISVPLISLPSSSSSSDVLWNLICSETSVLWYKEQCCVRGMLVLLNLLSCAHWINEMKSSKSKHLLLLGLKQALETVNDYNPLMKDFPLNDLLSATELDKIRQALVAIFTHLRKIRNTKYPIQRALRLVEAISRDLSSQLLKVLGTRKLMHVAYEEFEKVCS